MKVFHLFFKDNELKSKFWLCSNTKEQAIDKFPSFKDIFGESCFIFKFSDLRKEKNQLKKIKFVSWSILIFLLGKYYKIAGPKYLVQLVNNNLGKEVFIVSAGGIGVEIYKFHFGSENTPQVFIDGRDFLKALSKDSIVFKFLSYSVLIKNKLFPKPKEHLIPKLEVIGCYAPYFLTYLKNRFEPTQFKVRYFDIFGKDEHLGEHTISVLKNLGISDISSYHKSLCEKTNIKYILNRVNQSKLKAIQQKVPSCKYGACYLGWSSKARDSMQMELFEYFQKFDLKVFALIREYKNGPTLFGYPVHTVPLSYPKYLETVAESNALVDLWRLDEDEGYSYRLSEAMVMNKKIITNRKKIIKEPFYDPKRFFVLGIDSLENLKKFLDEPLSPLSETELKPFILEE